MGFERYKNATLVYLSRVTKNYASDAAEQLAAELKRRFFDKNNKYFDIQSNWVTIKNNSFTNSINPMIEMMLYIGASEDDFNSLNQSKTKNVCSCLDSIESIIRSSPDNEQQNTVVRKLIESLCKLDTDRIKAPELRASVIRNTSLIKCLFELYDEQKKRQDVSSSYGYIDDSQQPTTLVTKEYALPDSLTKLTRSDFSKICTCYMNYNEKDKKKILAHGAKHFQSVAKGNLPYEFFMYIIKTGKVIYGESYRDMMLSAIESDSRDITIYELLNEFKTWYYSQDGFTDYGWKLIEHTALKAAKESASSYRAKYIHSLLDPVIKTIRENSGYVLEEILNMDVNVKLWDDYNVPAIEFNKNKKILQFGNMYHPDGDNAYVHKLHDVMWHLNHQIPRSIELGDNNQYVVTMQRYWGEDSIDEAERTTIAESLNEMVQLLVTIPIENPKGFIKPPQVDFQTSLVVVLNDILKYKVNAGLITDVELRLAFKTKDFRPDYKVFAALLFDGLKLFDFSKDEEIETFFNSVNDSHLTYDYRSSKICDTILEKIEKENESYQSISQLLDGNKNGILSFYRLLEASS